MIALRRTAVLLLPLVMLAACDEDTAEPGGTFIKVDEAAVAFSAEARGADPAPKQLVIGTTSGTISTITSAIEYVGGNAEGWLSAQVAASGAEAVLTLTPSIVDLDPGTYTAVVILEAPGFDNSPRGIQVSLQVIGVVGPRVFSYTPPPGAPEITSVSLRGEMNGWGETPMAFADGKWSVTLPLDTGTYHYKFYINETWPGNMCHDEIFGHPDENFYIDPEAEGCRGDSDARVHVTDAPGPMFSYTPPEGAPEVTSISVRGEMNGWGETPMIFLRSPPNDFGQGEWRVSAVGLSGAYLYKYYINETWPGNMCHDEIWGDPANDFWIDPDAEECVPGDNNARRTF
jgi:hypothetical protein